MIGNIISLSAVCVTLLLGIAGLIANSLIQRKSNSIQIITQTDPEKTQTAKEIVGLVSELRALYSFSFDKDIRLVTAAFEIKEPLCNHLPQNALYPSEINEKRRLFAEIADIYLSLIHISEPTRPY